MKHVRNIVSHLRYFWLIVFLSIAIIILLRISSFLYYQTILEEKEYYSFIESAKQNSDLSFCKWKKDNNSIYAVYFSQNNFVDTYNKKRNLIDKFFNHKVFTMREYSTCDKLSNDPDILNDNFYRERLHWYIIGIENDEDESIDLVLILLNQIYGHPIRYFCVTDGEILIAYDKYEFTPWKSDWEHYIEKHAIEILEDDGIDGTRFTLSDTSRRTCVNESGK